FDLWRPRALARWAGRRPNLAYTFCQGVALPTACDKSINLLWCVFHNIMLWFSHRQEQKTGWMAMTSVVNNNHIALLRFVAVFATRRGSTGVSVWVPRASTRTGLLRNWRVGTDLFAVWRSMWVSMPPPPRACCL